MNQTAITKLLLANQATIVACQQELKKTYKSNEQLLALLVDGAKQQPTKEQIAAAEASLRLKKSMNQRKPKI